MEIELEKMNNIFFKYMQLRSHWLILGNLNDALTLKTDAILSVLENDYIEIIRESINLAGTNKDWLAINIRDDKTQNIVQHFEKAFEFLDRMEKENKKCIIHCQAGINRSATIALAYYMKKTNTKLFDAYEHLISKRRGIIFNNGFRKQLIQWATDNNLI